MLHKMGAPFSSSDGSSACGPTDASPVGSLSRVCVAMIDEIGSAAAQQIRVAHGGSYVELEGGGSLVSALAGTTQYCLILFCDSLYGLDSYRMCVGLLLTGRLRSLFVGYSGSLAPLMEWTDPSVRELFFRAIEAGVLQLLDDSWLSVHSEVFAV